MIIKEFDVKEIDKLKDAWENLEDGKDMSVFQTYGWNDVLKDEFLWTTFKRIYRKLIYTCVLDDDGNVKLIAPLRVKKLIKKSGLVKEVELLGEDSFSDYVNLIYKDVSDDVFDALFNYLKEKYKGYKLKWGSIKEDSEFGKYILKKYPNNSGFDRKCVIIPLKFESFEDYFNSLSKNARQHYRTRKNRLNKNGLSLTYKVDGQIPKEEALELMILNYERTIEKNKEQYKTFFSRAKEKYNCTHKSFPLYQMIHNIYAWTLTSFIGGEKAGFLTGCLKDGVAYIIMNKVNIKYEYYSPMIVSTIDYIKDIYENNLDIKVLDFGRGTEEYKYRLGGVDVNLIKIEYTL